MARTSRSGAGARLVRHPCIGDRRNQVARDRVRIDGWLLDVCGVITTGAGRGGRKESEGQTCQRHSGWRENHTSPEDTHGATRNRKRRKVMVLSAVYTLSHSYNDNKSFTSSCKPKMEKTLISSTENRGCAFFSHDARPATTGGSPRRTPSISSHQRATENSSCSPQGRPTS